MKSLRRYFFRGILFALCLVPLKVLYHRLFALTALTISFDPLFSSTAQKEIQTSCDRFACSSMSTASFDQLIQDFPIIKTITCSHKKVEHVLLRIDAHQPLYLINQHEVLIESGALVKKEYFTNEGINSLYSLSIFHEYTQLPHEFAFWLEEHADHLFERFNICLINPTEIVLTDKQQQTFKILCHDKNRITKELLKQCLQLKNEMKHNPKPRRDLVWIADIRFKNQIILYGKRGNNEGKIVF